jgi:hypothetical protein
VDQRTAAILAVVRGLAVHELTATMRTPQREAVRSFAGAALADYAVAAGLLDARPTTDELASGCLRATAADGQRVAVALAELWPALTRKTLLLAHQQDGAPVRDGVRLVVTGDHLSGRSLGGVVSIERGDARSGAASAGSDGLTLLGRLDRPTTIARPALASRAVIDVHTHDIAGHGGQPLPPHHFRGPRVYELLAAAGLRLDPAVHEDVLGHVIVATGADGRSAVIAAGELEPRFMNGDAIVATEVDGVATEPRLVVPFDRTPARWIKQLVSLEFRDA